MNKFKKVLLVILAAVAVFAVAFAVGCGNNKKLQALKVDASNAKTVYFLGQEFSSDGLVVTADLGKSETQIKETVTLNPEEYTVDSSAYKKDVEGTYSIKVSYTLDNVTLETSYDVIVAEAEFDGLQVTLAEGVTDTITLSAEVTSATIDVSKIVVKEVNPADGTVAGAITGYSVALYKGAEKVTLTDNKATVGGGAYQIWVSKDSEVIKDFTRESFVNIFVIDDLASIALDEGATLTQEAGEDIISSSWKFTATYVSGATKDLTIDDVTVTGLNTKTAAEEAKATVSYTDVNAKGTEATKTVEVTYTITPSDGKTRITVTADISALVAAGTLSATDYATETALADGISILASSDKKVTIDENGKKIDGFEFTHRLKLNGAGTIEGRSIKFVTAGAAKITVYMMSGSSSADRPVGLFVEDSSVVEGGNLGLGLIEGSSQTSLGASIAKFEYSVSEAGTYYLASLSSGVNVYYVSMVTTIESDPGTSTLTPVVLSALDLTTGEFTAETAWGNNAGFALMGTSSKKLNVDSETTAKSIAIDDSALAIQQRVKMGGAIGSDFTRSIKLTLGGACKIEVWGLGGGASNTGRKLKLLNSSGKEVGTSGLDALTATVDPATDATIDSRTITLSAEDVAASEGGVFYLGGDAGINIYYIRITYTA